ncbi:MAG: flagellar biosynthesis protein FlgA [Alphaproteobacteria bacterium]|jgi:predicted homoserine dehydrogenase-like protein|nr:flagellar biosynthesis protein FlgA [Alphaproteobacteria bacterium]
MNLHRLLAARAEAANPVRVGLIGAGKFGAMFLAQARRTTGLHILGIADLDVARARASCHETGWTAEQIGAASLSEALRGGATYLGDDAEALIRADGLDVVIEATGNPVAGIRHCLAGLEHGRHMVMVNVEADVVAGPLLARRARQAGLVYSLAYGDQPALICEHVDWARAAGFDVVCAGKGTRYHPSFHQSTPETVWDNIGITAAQARRGGMNPKMFNSFVDGTKSGIEMTAVCNATGLTPQPGGLGFPPTPSYALAETCKPRADGGVLAHRGTTEVVSSLNRDMTPVDSHIQMGTYVVVETDSDYVRHCFEEYRMLPDRSLRFAALYRPLHMIGLELGISVASVALRGEPTGAPDGFRSDVVATAKRPLGAGELLDGEGGTTVWGKQMPAPESLARGSLPLGLASGVALVRDVPEGAELTWRDVAIDATDPAVVIRRQMEAAFARPDKGAEAAE